MANPEGDKWEKPEGADEDLVFLMVQLMETWFLADREMLISYFGTQFLPKHIREWPSLENASKQDVLDALAKATARCDRGRQYAKGKTSFEMLAKLSPDLVENACPNAARLLKFLRNVQ